MNARLIQGIIGAVVGVFLMTMILTGEGSVIGQTAMFGLVACFLFGFIAPKPGIVLMVVLAGYSDLIKRLMVLETRISMLDLAYILGMAPATLAGVVLACLVRKIFYQGLEKRDLVTFGVSTIFLMVGIGFAVAKSDTGMKALRLVADYGAFSYLIFVLPILYPTKEDLIGLMKTTLLIFVPVAIYGIWQRIFGLADFEYRYLMTGMSIEARQLMDVRVRPFSTLNAATSLTMVAAAGVIMTMLVHRAGRFNGLVATTLIILFAWCCFMTFTRVGWAVLLASLCLIPVLRFKVSTAAMYVGGIMAFIFVIWQSDYLMENLHHWQRKVYSAVEASPTGEQGLRITTLSDRIIGFRNMKNPDNWTPFGIREEGHAIEGLASIYSTTFSHDLISRFLFQFGYIAFGIAAISISASMFVLHRAVFRLPHERQRFAQLALAGVFGALCSLTTGGTVFQFPSNIFFWLLFCFVLVTVWEAKRKLVSKKLLESAEKEGEMSGMVRLGEVGR